MKPEGAHVLSVGRHWEERQIVKIFCALGVHEPGERSGEDSRMYASAFAAQVRSNVSWARVDPRAGSATEFMLRPSAEDGWDLLPATSVAMAEIRYFAGASSVGTVKFH